MVVCVLTLEADHFALLHAHDHLHAQTSLEAPRRVVCQREDKFVTGFSESTSSPDKLSVLTSYLIVGCFLCFSVTLIILVGFFQFQQNSHSPCLYIKSLLLIFDLSSDPNLNLRLLVGGADLLPVTVPPKLSPQLESENC